MGAALDALGVRHEAGPAWVLARQLLDRARQSALPHELWLAIIAITGGFPTREQFIEARVRLTLSSDDNRISAVLGNLVELAATSDSFDPPMRVVTEGVLIDVDFCATEEHNSGIQRVVRQTVRNLSEEHVAELVAWTQQGRAMRVLDERETARVVDWNGQRDHSIDLSPVRELVVPFGAVVVVPEVPQPRIVDRLAALAEFSNNRVALIGYDTIPIVSADLVPSLESERFVHYLTIVKHADVVAAISGAVADEFRGFGSMLASQGLSGPRVATVPLAEQSPSESTVSADGDPRPLFLCVGSQEPRKNQEAVLFAADVLWREGHDFRLRFIGGGDINRLRDFDKHVATVRAAGRQVDVLRRASDAVLASSYASAHAFVFPSLQEGFGLPVTEALSFGVPVITSCYGSTAEIAEGGGCLTIDPRNDAELVGAMRRLLIEPKLVATLRAQAHARVPRDWADYARDLWTAAIEPLVTEAARG